MKYRSGQRFDITIPCALCRRTIQGVKSCCQRLSVARREAPPLRRTFAAAPMTSCSGTAKEKRPSNADATRKNFSGSSITQHVCCFVRCWTLCGLRCESFPSANEQVVCADSDSRTTCEESGSVGAFGGAWSVSTQYIPRLPHVTSGPTGVDSTWRCKT